MANFKIDYIFLNQDNSKDSETLEENDIPNTGDGKIHNNKSYEIIFKGENLISRPNPLVLAVEIDSKP
jgi:hypothetical protein